MVKNKHILIPFLLLCLIGFAAAGFVALGAPGLFLAMFRERPAAERNW